MSFILLHHENSFCAHEPCLVNVTQIASVLPVSGFGKIYAERSHAAVRLTDGKTIRVKESLEIILGMLRSASGGMPVAGAGPRLLQSRPAS